MPERLGDVLELGSGYGQLAGALRSRATRYVCLELELAMVHEIRARLGVSGIVADIHRLPFRDAAFETVVANNVIEHAHNPVRALTEIRRVLRPSDGPGIAAARRAESVASATRPLVEGRRDEHRLRARDGAAHPQSSDRTCTSLAFAARSHRAMDGDALSKRCEPIPHVRYRRRIQTSRRSE